MSETTEKTSFFERDNVKIEVLPVAGGVPFGVETVINPELGIAGAYGAWGESYDNARLPELVGERLGEPFPASESMNLSELGFVSRHHIKLLNDADNVELEYQVGSKLLQAAMTANGWKPEEIDGVLIGTSAPVSTDFVEQISLRAGIRPDALMVNIHKACDGSAGALHLALNPDLTRPGHINIAEKLAGKKVLVGGIEGLSRFTSKTRDKNALQLFGNGAAVIGVIPGVTMKLLAGRAFEDFDTEGLLQVRMYYPHHLEEERGSILEIQEENATRIRFSGRMHEPADGSSIVMAGLMGMVKLFVRNGVKVVEEVIHEYTGLMERQGTPGRKIDVAIAHHANFKINLLKAKQLLKDGIEFPMPWLLNDFGNVSAASCMIAFLRQLPKIKPSEHILIDGFGAGTYYDVMAISMG